MEYERNICISSDDFNTLLASGYDCDMYLKMSALLGGFFGGLLLIMVNRFLIKQSEIDNLLQVKKSLMEHIVALEDELTKAYTKEEEEEAEAEAEEENLDDNHED
jgi:hypothetical protein